MIKELVDKLKQDEPRLAPLRVWNAYEQLGQANSSPKTELTAIVAMVRKLCGIDDELTPYSKTVDKNVKEWVFAKQAGQFKIYD